MKEEFSHQNHVLLPEIRESDAEIGQENPYFNNATFDIESQNLKVRSQKLEFYKICAFPVFNTLEVLKVPLG